MKMHYYMFLVIFGVHSVVGQMYGFNNMFNFPFQDSYNYGTNLGNSIMRQVQQQLRPLQNLGARIQEQVKHSLLPVEAISIRNAMRNGVGGVTVSTYRGNFPRSFITQNGIRHICNGIIIGPTCQGTLEPFRILNNSDLCYTRSYAIINNKICLSEGAPVVSVDNNVVTCRSEIGQTLLLSKPDYVKMCGNEMPGLTHNIYYGNKNDPQTIKIPNRNPYVKCDNNQIDICEFTVESFENGRNTHVATNFVYVSHE